MKKITFYKHMSGYDENRGGYYSGEGQYRFGYHFEAEEGYLYTCANGLQAAFSRTLGGYWKATELSSGCLFAPDARTINELKERAEIASIPAKRLLDNATQYLADTVQALRAYVGTVGAA